MSSTCSDTTLKGYLLIAVSVIGAAAVQINAELSLNILFLPAIIALSGWLAWTRWRQKNISFIFYGSYWFFFGIFPLIWQLLGVEDAYPPGVGTRANVIILVTLLCLFIGETTYLRMNWLIRKRSDHRLSHRRSWLQAPMTQKQAEVIMWTAFILSVAGFLGSLLFGSLSMSEMVNTPRMELRLKVNSSKLLLANYMMTLGMIAAYIALDRGRRWHKLLVPSLLIMNILVTGIYGGRAGILNIIGPILFYYAVRKQERTHAIMAFGVIAVVSIVFLVGILHTFRWQGTRDPATFVRTVKNPMAYEFMFLSSRSDINAKGKLLQAIDTFPAKHGWLYGNTYRCIALFWLPSRLAAGLKVDTMYLYAYAVTGDPAVFTKSLSLHPTFAGDLYVNFGPLFWIGALFWGLLFGYIHRITTLYKDSILCTVLGSSWVYLLILTFRGSIYQSFMKLMACAFFLIMGMLALRIVRHRNGRRLPGYFACDV